MARPRSAIHYKTRFDQNKAQAARKARRDKNKIRGQTKRAAIKTKSRRDAKKGRLRSVSRILWLLRTGIHLSARADCSDPAPPCGVRHTRCVMDEPPHTLHCLAPNWVCNARRDCSDGGGLLHPLFTLTACAAVYFCCTFLGVTSTGRYPASCPVKPGLSSPVPFRVPYG